MAEPTMSAPSAGRTRNHPARGRGWIAVALTAVVLVGAGVAFGPAVWRRLSEPAPVPLATLNLDALTPSMIVKSDGTRHPIALPPVRTAGRTWLWTSDSPGARVAGGFVFPVSRDDGGVMPDGSPEPADGPVPDGGAGPYANGKGGGSELWFLGDGAPKPVFVAFFSGSWAVAADGTAVVLTGVVLDGYLSVLGIVAYRLPDLTVLKGPESVRLLDVHGNPPRVVGVTATEAILQTSDDQGPLVAAWPLGPGAVSWRPSAYALATSADGRVLMLDAGPRPCLNLMTVQDALADRPIGSACLDARPPWPTASLSPDGAWAVFDGAFPDDPGDDEDDQNHALVRTADLAAGRWAPVRQRPFAQRSAVAHVPYVWASDTTFVVQRWDFTFFSRFDPFRSSRVPGRYYLCGVDNGPCAPLRMPDGLDEGQPLARYPST